MRKLFLLFACLFSFLSLQSHEPLSYVEPQDVATTEGLPSSLVNQSVCAITGEYTDSVVDVVLPGPEPLVISRVYTSSAIDKPWTFNHQEKLLMRTVSYEGYPAYYVALRQASGAMLDYIFKKKKDFEKQKELSFEFINPPGLVNGPSLMSGKTNLRNQTVEYLPYEERIVSQSGAGHRKIFKQIALNDDAFPIYGQIAEEKVNGSLIKYQGHATGIRDAEEILCGNPKTEKCFSSVKFQEKRIAKDLYLQTLVTSDQRQLDYVFQEHLYTAEVKKRNAEIRDEILRYYLIKVDHPYAPTEKYQYKEKALSQDMHLTAKFRDEGRRFCKIDYYLKGTNQVGGKIGDIQIEKGDDFRLDRVQALREPVGTDKTPITTHRFDYHATIKKHKIDGHKKIADGYTDVYDAMDHKTRYHYDEKHRLTSIIRYSNPKASPNTKSSNKKDSTYTIYSKEWFYWDDEGNLTAKLFIDGEDNIHHARLFTYDSYGNVKTSTLCGKLTGKASPPLILDSNGKLEENGYERETKTFTYSKNGLNLLLTETDAAGKTIRYTYQKNSDILKAKYLSYNGKIQIREFYSYDDNNVLVKKVLDNGCEENEDDLSYVNERHYTYIAPKTERPYGLPASSDERFLDFETHNTPLLKRSNYHYSPEGRLLKQEVFDKDGNPAYELSWDYDLHGNLISETNALGETSTKKHDQATDNLIEQNTPDIQITNTYDFANRLIEQIETRPEEEISTTYQYDYLGNCKSITNPYGHETKQFFDDFGRMTEIHSPQVPLDGVLTTPIVKTSYDIAGFPIKLTDANGRETNFEVNIRGQPTKIIYPDGTTEEMSYSLDGKLMEKKAKNGTRTEYKRDPLGRITEELVYGEVTKKTTYRYNSFHLVETIDPEGNQTHYGYDWAGRLKEIRKFDHKTEYAYDSLGRQAETREYYGHEPNEFRITRKKYDLLDRVKEETLESAEGNIIHQSIFEYDSRGNQRFIQVGDQKTTTVYNSWNQPSLITDALGNQTHIDYNTHFMNSHGQRVLQKTTIDPLGYKIVETFDTANRLTETIRMNPLGQKVAKQTRAYDLVGNLTQIEDEVIEEIAEGTPKQMSDGKQKEKPIARILKSTFKYDNADQVKEITEAAGTAKQKISCTTYNTKGQKESFTKPDGKKILYTYDAFGRLKTQKASDNSIDYLFEYNLLDQITKVTDQKTKKVSEREYLQGEIKKETLANGLTLTYTYDRTGRARTIEFPDKTGVEYVYNAVDLKEIHRQINERRTYCHYDLQHSLSGKITQAQPPGSNGNMTYEFDLLDRCISIQSPAFCQEIPSNGFDVAGNLLQCEIQKTPYTFTYDDHYHLQSESGHSSHTYAFDSLSNRTIKDKEKCEHNALNQIVKKGEQALEYDLNGNLKRNGLFEYEYDVLDRLIKVTSKEKVITYTYDSFNRRLSRKIKGDEELFLYQGQEEIGRWKKGICQEVRLLGKNAHSPTVAIEIQGIPYVPLHDMQGNISAIANLQGELIEQYRFTAFGEREILDPSGKKLNRSTIGNPWQYAGKRIDEETSLIAFGFRDYDPALGRWTTPDPAGFIDGSNLYTYNHSNPLKYHDEFGLIGLSDYCLTFKLLKGACGINDQNYQRYCTPTFGDSIGNNFDPATHNFISHFNIEDKFEYEYNILRNEGEEPFRRTGHYCANDFIDPGTNKPYNFKPLPQDKLILFINGIGNTWTDFQNSVLHLAKMTDYNIQGVFCPTLGFALDAACYNHALKDFAAYEGTRELQKIIQNFCDNTPTGATMLVICHSRGVLYTRNGLIDLPAYCRKRAEVLAVAPGAYVDERLSNRVVHYLSMRHDVVPFIDREGQERCKDTIKPLHQHPDAPFFDHSFNSPTYTDTLRIQMEHYLRR